MNPSLSRVSNTELVRELFSRSQGDINGFISKHHHEPDIVASMEMIPDEFIFKKNRYIEMMAAAYMTKTLLPPDKVKIVQKIIPPHQMELYYEKRNEEDNEDYQNYYTVDPDSPFFGYPY